MVTCLTDRGLPNGRRELQHPYGLYLRMATGLGAERSFVEAALHTHPFVLDRLMRVGMLIGVVGSTGSVADRPDVLQILAAYKLIPFPYPTTQAAWEAAPLGLGLRADFELAEQEHDRLAAEKGTASTAVASDPRNQTLRDAYTLATAKAKAGPNDRLTLWQKLWQRSLAAPPPPAAHYLLVALRDAVAHPVRLDVVDKFVQDSGISTDEFVRMLEAVLAALA